MIFIGFRIKTFFMISFQIYWKGKTHVVLSKQSNAKKYNDSRIMK